MGHIRIIDPQPSSSTTTRTKAAGCQCCGRKYEMCRCFHISALRITFTKGVRNHRHIHVYHPSRRDLLGFSLLIDLFVLNNFFAQGKPRSS